MILKNGTMEEFIKNAEGKTVVALPVGFMFHWMLNLEQDYHLDKRISFTCDNDRKKHGKPTVTRYGKYDTHAVEDLKKLDPKKLVVIVVHEQFPAIVEQLDSMPELDEAECYVYPIMHALEHRHDEITYGTEQKIPKKIHYVWFGGSPLPTIAEQCIASWKKFCPDYEIIRWDEGNYDVDTSLYAREAYVLGEYHYVSDYARLDIIHRHGGIYFDIDVEAVKNFDPLLTFNGYCCYTNFGSTVTTGYGFGASAGYAMLKEFIDLYKNQSFVEFTLQHFNGPDCITSVLRGHGMKEDGSFQIIDDMAVLPRECLDPMGYWDLGGITKDTYSIHRWNCSLRDEAKRTFEAGKEAVGAMMRRMGVQVRSVEQ